MVIPAKDEVGGSSPPALHHYLWNGPERLGYLVNPGNGGKHDAACREAELLAKSKRTTRLFLIR